MLRLFSSIRKSLLAENKTIRYLKYAVGEVLLIMVGILLALQLNNWNEGRKLEQDRRELIESLTTDFETNLKRLDESLLVADKKEESAVALLAASTENSTISVNELKLLATESFLGGISFDPSLSAYRAALASGSIALIGNNSLYGLLTEFEEVFRAYIHLENLGREHHFLGNISRLREKVGSIEILFPNSQVTSGLALPIPEKYALSNQEYLELIAEKEVYAAIASKREIKFRQRGRLRNLKALAEQILTALEALD